MGNMCVSLQQAFPYSCNVGNPRGYLNNSCGFLFLVFQWENLINNFNSFGYEKPTFVFTAWFNLTDVDWQIGSAMMYSISAIDPGVVDVK